MKLDNVKYTPEGRPYVEAGVKSGLRKGYVTRRFGKILKCLVCGKDFFARNEQLKKGMGKFCGVGCAKTASKKTKRRQELSDRRSKKIKNKTVYFTGDGRIYTENKDKKGKVYRYYGEIRRCAVCGDGFFANFSQIKLDRARCCSHRCATKKEDAPSRAGTIAEKEVARRPERPRDRDFYTRNNERAFEEGRRVRPAGVLAFGIVWIYIGIYYLVEGLRASGSAEIRIIHFALMAASILFGYGILTLKPWIIALLYAYFTVAGGGAFIVYCTAFIADAPIKATLLSGAFIRGLLLALAPYALFLIYVINPDVKERFRRP